MIIVGGTGGSIGVGLPATASVSVSPGAGASADAGAQPQVRWSFAGAGGPAKSRGKGRKPSIVIGQSNLGSWYLMTPQALDFGFGTYINGTFDLCARDAGPSNWRTFLSRAPSGRIRFVENESIPEALAEMSRAETRRDYPSLSKPKLPQIMYSRRPGWKVVPEGEGGRRDLATWLPEMPTEVETVNGKEDRIYYSRVTKLSAMYSVAMVAWDMQTLDYMIMAWHAFVPNRRFFMVKVNFDDSWVEVPAEIFPVSETDWQDKSVMLYSQSEEGRIFAVGAEIELRADFHWMSRVPIPKGPFTIAFGGRLCSGVDVEDWTEE